MLNTLHAKVCGSQLPALSGNIYCVGRNYAEHAKELQNEVPSEPVIFLKAPSALRLLEAGPLACPDETFHHEVELVLLVGQHLTIGSRAQLSDLAGITLGIDLTRRGVQDQLKKKGLPWCLAKSFSGSALIVPFTGPVSSVLLEQTLDFRLEVNGALRQEGDTSQMLFPFLAILNYLLRLQDLYPGDLIYTGTPAGVGPIQKGDSMLVQSRALGIHARGIL